MANESEIPSTWAEAFKSLLANSLWILPLIAGERIFEGYIGQAAIAGGLWVILVIAAVKLHVFQELVSNRERRRRVLTWALIFGGAALLIFGIARLATLESSRGNSGLSEQDADQRVSAATAPLKQQIDQLKTALQATQQQRDEALSHSSASTITQPPLSNLSAQDIATQIGVWTLIDDRMNELASILNRGYEHLDRWKVNVKSDQQTEIKNVADFGTSIEIFRRQLADLRDLYLNDPQISSVLMPVVIPGGRTNPSATIFLALRASVEQFVAQLQNLKVEGMTDSELDAKMIPYVGAFKRDLNAMRSWQGQVRSASGEQQTQLSQLQSK